MREEVIQLFISSVNSSVLNLYNYLIKDSSTKIQFFTKTSVLSQKSLTFARKFLGVLLV